ncbi:hypothetical protein HK102_000524 [Quaeritorhiza haematococci]|nr:hypothetical protein HK102_000524 [Quaeritorhiza haematococci]
MASRAYLSTGRLLRHPYGASVLSLLKDDAKRISAARERLFGSATESGRGPSNTTATRKASALTASSGNNLSATISARDTDGSSSLATGEVKVGLTAAGEACFSDGTHAEMEDRDLESLGNAFHPQATELHLNAYASTAELHPSVSTPPSAPYPTPPRSTRSRTTFGTKKENTQYSSTSLSEPQQQEQDQIQNPSVVVDIGLLSTAFAKGSKERRDLRANIGLHGVRVDVDRGFTTPPTSPQPLTLNNHPTPSLTPYTSRLIAYVPPPKSETDTFPTGSTVRETIAHYVRCGVPKRWTKAEGEQFVDLLVEGFGLAHVAHTIITNPTAAGILSDRQRRHLGICLAVTALPLVLIVEEPTLGLDPATSTTIAQALSALSKLHITVIVTLGPRSMLESNRHQDGSVDCVVDNALFEVFDDVLMVSPRSGRTICAGPFDVAREWFEGIGVEMDSTQGIASTFASILLNQAKLKSCIQSGALASTSPEPTLDVEDLADMWEHRERHQSSRREPSPTSQAVASGIVLGTENVTDGMDEGSRGWTNERDGIGFSRPVVVPEDVSRHRQYQPQHRPPEQHELAPQHVPIQQQQHVPDVGRRRYPGDANDLNFVQVVDPSSQVILAPVQLRKAPTSTATFQPTSTLVDILGPPLPPPHVRALGPSHVYTPVCFPPAPPPVTSRHANYTQQGWRMAGIGAGVVTQGAHGVVNPHPQPLRTMTNTLGQQVQPQHNQYSHITPIPPALELGRPPNMLPPVPSHPSRAYPTPAPIPNVIDVETPFRPVTLPVFPDDPADRARNVRIPAPLPVRVRATAHSGPSPPRYPQSLAQGPLTRTIVIPTSVLAPESAHSDPRTGPPTSLQNSPPRFPPHQPESNTQRPRTPPPDRTSAAGSSPKEVDLAKLSRQRGARWGNQVWLVCEQKMLRIIRGRGVQGLLLEVVRALLAGLVLGFWTNEWNGELFRGIYRHPFEALSPIPQAWVVPLCGTLIGIAAAVTSASVGARGHSPTAQYLGAVFATLPRILLISLHFAATFHFLARPAGIAFLPTFWGLIAILFLGVYTTSSWIGLGVTACRRWWGRRVKDRRKSGTRRDRGVAKRDGVEEDVVALVVCVVITMVGSGFGSGLAGALEIPGWVDGIWYASINTWFTEALLTRFSAPYQHIYDVSATMSSFSESSRHLVMDRLPLDLAAMAALILVHTFVGFVLFWLVYVRRGAGKGMR